MANKVSYSFDIVGNFRKMASGITKGAKSMARGMKTVGNESQTAGRKTTRSFASMKKGAVGLKNAMLPLVATFIGIGGAIKAIGVGLGFEDAVADLGAVTFIAGKDLEFLRGQAMEMGEELRISSAEVATAFKIVGSAKSELVNTPKLLAETSKQALLLAKASGTDLAMSADALVGSLNQFNVGADQSSRFVNVLAAGARVGASELIDTAAAMANVGTVAADLGISFETTNAGIQVLARNAQKGSQAGTKFQSVLQKLETSGVKELSISSRGLIGVLETLSNANLDAATKGKLVGIENVKILNILTKNIPMLKQFTKEMTGTNDAQIQASKRMATLSSKMKGLGVIVQNFVIRAFDDLAPQFDEMVTSTKAWLESISVEDIQAFAGALRDVASAVGEIVSGVATLAGSETAQKLFGLGRASIAGLSDLATLVTGGELTAANSASFRNAVKREQSQTDVNVNLNAPAGVVGSIQSKTTGKATGLNVGVNMAEAG